MVAGNNRSAIPMEVFRRFPTYLKVLEALRKAGRPLVSETHLAEALGIDAAQVQFDLNYVGHRTFPQSNLVIDNLVDSLHTVLGWDDYNRAVLVGVGHLGRSLLAHPAFRRWGLEIVAAFDDAPARVGQTIGGVPVLPLDKLETLVARLHVHLGILTVPASAAQEMADRLVAAGVGALWNFAPCQLTLPPDIIVKTQDMPATLDSFTFTGRLTPV